MTVYATPDELIAAASYYGIEPPPAGHRERLLEQASGEVARHLGFAWALDEVDVVQASALRDATTAQALYRHAQDNPLDLDDGLASVGPLSISLRRAPRFTPEAAEILAGHGLFVRSGTVDPPLIVVVDAG